MILAIIAAILVAVAVIGAAVASQEAASQVAAQEEQRGAICRWCGDAKGWYSNLPLYKKAWYSAWRATTQIYCLGNGCGW